MEQSSDSLVSVLERLEAVYMTWILSHNPRGFCIRAPGKDIEFVPLGAVSGTWMHL